MITIDWKPETSTLRQFGWIALGGFGLAGALLAWRVGAFSGSGRWLGSEFLWALAIICPLLALLKPTLLRFIYLPMMVVALPIGLVIGTLGLLLIFFLIFTPLAVWFRIRGRDILKRNPDPELGSYWVGHESDRGPESYYHQY